jgi:hypothetical protein
MAGGPASIATSGPVVGNRCDGRDFRLRETSVVFAAGLMCRAGLKLDTGSPIGPLTGRDASLNGRLAPEAVVSRLSFD